MMACEILDPPNDLDPTRTTYANMHKVQWRITQTIAKKVPDPGKSGKRSEDGASRTQMKRLEAIGEVTTKQIKTSNTGTSTAHQIWSQPIICWTTYIQNCKRVEIVSCRRLQRFWICNAYWMKAGLRMPKSPTRTPHGQIPPSLTS